MEEQGHEQQVCRKTWNKGDGEKQMELALCDVAKGVLTVRKAALVYGIPKSTLHDHVSGKVRPGAGVGLPKYLTDEEEDELVRWLEGCAEVGCAKSVRDTRAVVGAIVAKKQRVECAVVSHGWWDRFRKRHPHLTMRAGEALAYRRAVATSPETFSNYFDQLEEVLDTNGLRHAPSRIFNADESGIPLQHRPGRRIAVRGQKHVIVNTSGNKTQITVLACISASGCYIPPMVIFKRKGLTEDLIEGEVPDTIYGLSPKSGWMDGELFSQWFRCHFLKYAPSIRPILLLLDGHSSHYNPQLIREAAGAGVILFCLPPNVTHVAQPLDVTPFHSLKVHWDHVCDQYMSLHPGKIVTIYEFSQLFSCAWHQAMTPSTILSSFRATGVYPFNRQALNIPGVAKEVVTPTAKLAQREGIRYMPFFSPRPNRQAHSSEQFTQQPVFSVEECHLFKRRLEEGYDIPDSRYRLWLQLQSGHGALNYSPPTSPSTLESDDISFLHQSPPTSESPIGSSSAPKSRGRASKPLWSEFLTVPSPAYKAKPAQAGQARVLTSSSFLHELAEKERKKKEAAEEKERRKKEREEKKALKEKEKALKEKKKAAKKEKSIKASKKPSSSNKSSRRQLHPSQQLPFSEEEQQLFERRYEEGYDIPDPRYLLWLQQQHTDGTRCSISQASCCMKKQRAKQPTMKSSVYDDESSDFCK